MEIRKRLRCQLQLVAAALSRKEVLPPRCKGTSILRMKSAHMFLGLFKCLIDLFEIHLSDFDVVGFVRVRFYFLYRVFRSLSCRLFFLLFHVRPPWGLKKEPTETIVDKKDFFKSAEKLGRRAFPEAKESAFRTPSRREGLDRQQTFFDHLLLNAGLCHITGVYSASLLCIV